MQPTPLLSKSLRERNHDGNIYRLVSTFNCCLNVAGLNVLRYNFNHSFWVLSWKVLWTSGNLSPSSATTTTTNFSKESKYLKQLQKFFQGIPVPKFIQGLSKYAFLDPSIFPGIQGTVDTLIFDKYLHCISYSLNMNSAVLI